MKTSNFRGGAEGNIDQNSLASLALEVLLIYEDRNTGMRARQAIEHAARQPEFAAGFNVDLWRFDLLAEPAVRKWVLNKTLEADIIFISAHGHSELPEAVLTLLNQWLTRKSDEPRALALSLDSSAKATTSGNQILDSLQAAAGPAGVDLFPHFEEPFLASEAEALLADDVRRGPEAYLHWGLNE